MAFGALPAVVEKLGIDHGRLMQDFVNTGASTMAALQPHYDDGVWIVEHVATAPEFRRQGHLDRLMAAILDKGRARGATQANIGVLIGNDNAQRAYEKNGFSVVEEILDADFEREYGCPGMRELIREI